MEPSRFHHDFASQLNVLAMSQYRSMGLPLLHQQFQHHIKIEPDMNFRFYNPDQNGGTKQEPRTEDEDDEEMSSMSASPPTHQVQIQQNLQQQQQQSQQVHHTTQQQSSQDNKHQVPQPLITHTNINHTNNVMQQQQTQQQMVQSQQQQHLQQSVDMLASLNNNHEITITRPPPKFKPKPQACKVCGKMLSSASSYYVHMKLHSGNKPYHCTSCEAAFCRKPYLEVHMRTHTGERPFQCVVCSKRFTQKSSLNTHKRVHTGERPYACDICDKRFAVKSYVTSHRWSHVGDKPFGCTSCHLTFTSKSQFAVHLRTHHTVGANHVCNVCGRAFVRDSYLIRHTNKVHGERVSSNLPHLITPDHFLHLTAQAQSALFNGDSCDVGATSPRSDNQTPAPQNNNINSSHNGNVSSPEKAPSVPPPPPVTPTTPQIPPISSPALMRINLQQISPTQAHIAQTQLIQQAQQRAQQVQQQACA